MEGRANLLAWLTMIAIAIGVAGYADYRPAGNADIVHYIATVHYWEGATGSDLRAKTYGDLQAFLSDDQYLDVTGMAGDPTINRNVYLRAIEADPEALRQQLPFYSVKPLYPALMAGLGLVGLSLGQASVLISAVCYFLTALLIFAWFRRHLGPWSSLLLGALVVLSAPFWMVARLSTPDALALLIHVAGLFVLLELRRPGLALAILIAAILARPNAVLTVLAVVAVVSVASRSSGIRLDRRLAVLGAVCGVALAASLSLWSGNYGLYTLFYHAVIAYLEYPVLGAPDLSLAEIGRVYLFRFVALSASPVPAFLLLGILAIRARVATPRAILDDGPSLVVLGMFASMAMTWLTYPNEPERILVGMFLVITIVLGYSVAPVVTAALAHVTGRQATLHPVPENPDPDPTLEPGPGAVAQGAPARS